MMGDWVCIGAGAAIAAGGVLAVRRATDPVGAYVGMGCFGVGVSLILFGVLRAIAMATVHP